MTKAYLYQQVAWQEVKPETYLHGSQIDFLADTSVHFQNELMPSGKLIHSWSSGVNYFTNRKGAELALLLPGRVYRLTYNMKSRPLNSVFIQISCYDRYDQAIETFYMRSSAETFKVPAKMYYYQVSLMNVGCCELIFHHFTLEGPLEEGIGNDLYD